MKAVLYIHGKGGSAAESRHYESLFPDDDVLGLDYRSFTPWETGGEIYASVCQLKGTYDSIILIANSIGAYFSMNAGIGGMVQEAFFISPIVDMDRLIGDMMDRAGISESELRAQGVIHTGSGEDLSWPYLCYVREHPIVWEVPTHILYGGNDHMTSLETIRDFANSHNFPLTVMENGEHWFHSEEQMMFMDKWIRQRMV